MADVATRAILPSVDLVTDEVELRVDRVLSGGVREPYGVITPCQDGLLDAAAVGLPDERRRSRWREQRSPPWRGAMGSGHS